MKDEGWRMEDKGYLRSTVYELRVHENRKPNTEHRIPNTEQKAPTNCQGFDFHRFPIGCSTLSFEGSFLIP